MIPDSLKWCIKSREKPCVFQPECGICPQQIIIEQKLWRIEVDDPEVILAITTTLAENEALIKNYFSGQTKAINVLFGKLMTATRGRVYPHELMSALKENLETYRK